MTTYLNKLVNIVWVEDITEKPMVSRDLAMVKVSVNAVNRAEVMQLVDVFRARIIDVGNDSLMIEITGGEDKIEGFIETLKPFGILEMVRAGVVAMGRGANSLGNPAGNGNGGGNGKIFREIGLVNSRLADFIKLFYYHKRRNKYHGKNEFRRR